MDNDKIEEILEQISNVRNDANGIIEKAQLFYDNYILYVNAKEEGKAKDETGKVDETKSEEVKQEVAVDSIRQTCLDSYTDTYQLFLKAIDNYNKVINEININYNSSLDKSLFDNELNASIDIDTIDFKNITKYFIDKANVIRSNAQEANLIIRYSQEADKAINFANNVRHYANSFRNDYTELIRYREKDSIYESYKYNCNQAVIKLKMAIVYYKCSNINKNINFEINDNLVYQNIDNYNYLYKCFIDEADKIIENINNSSLIKTSIEDIYGKIKNDHSSAIEIAKNVKGNNKLFKKSYEIYKNDHHFLNNCKESYYKTHIQFNSAIYLNNELIT